MTTLAKPRRLNQMENARPGMVGSVGDSLVSVQLAKSTPDSAVRFDPAFFNRPDDGSLLTGQPYTFDSAWNMGRSENTAYGMMQQDLRAPDKLHEPTLGSVPQYQWRNKIATVYEAKRSGQKFLPLPGPYVPATGEMVRGGQVVRTTDVEGLYSVVENQQESPSVGLGRYNDTNFNKFFSQNQKQSLKPSKTVGQQPLGAAPIVTNAPRPSLSSRSGNFSLMDPHNLAMTPVRISPISNSNMDIDLRVNTNVPRKRGPKAPSTPTVPNIPDGPRTFRPNQNLKINTDIPRARNPRAPTRGTFPPIDKIDKSEITAANIVGGKRHRRRRKK
jgi:hypothetical protein